MPAIDHAVEIELPPGSTADLSFEADEIGVRLRVPCAVELDEVSRYAVGMYISDAAHGLAFVEFCVRKDLEEAEELTVLLHSVDLDAPTEERLPPPRAEKLFADTRDHGEHWPAIVGAELVGPDGDVLDRW